MKTLKRIGLAGVFLFLLFLPCQVYAWDVNELGVEEVKNEYDTQITYVLKQRNYESVDAAAIGLGSLAREAMVGRVEKKECNI